MFLDTATGKVVDYCSEFSRTSFEVVHEGDYLLLNTGLTVECINLNTRRRQWVKPMHSAAWFYAHNGYVYNIYNYHSSGKASIVRSPVDRPDYETVYFFNRTDRFYPMFTSIGFGTLSNGNEIMVWKNRSYAGASDRTEFFAYDLTADTLMWRNTDLPYFSLLSQPIIDDDRVYGMVNNYVVCLNAFTGETLWKTNVDKLIKPQFNSGLQEGEAVVTEGQIVILGTAHKLFALDKSDGSLSYYASTVPDFIGEHLTYFEGKLFFSSGTLQIVEAETGQRLIFNPFNDEVDHIRGEIVIDPDRRVMYFSDNHYAYCARIPKL